MHKQAINQTATSTLLICSSLWGLLRRHVTMRSALLPSVGFSHRPFLAVAAGTSRSRSLRLQVSASKKKGKTSFRRNQTEPQQMRQMYKEMNSMSSQVNTPEVDPVNAEFVIFVRDAVEGKIPWTPLSIVKGSSAANLLVQACQTEWGRKLYQKTLIRNIAMAVYKDKSEIITNVRKANLAVLRYSAEKNFQFAMKIRDKSDPKSWVKADGITIFPPEDETKKTVVDTLKHFFSPDSLQSLASGPSSTASIEAPKDS